MKKPQKSVIQISTPARSRNYVWEEKVKYLPRNIEIVSIKDIEALPPKEKNSLFSRKDIEVGDVFIKDEITGQYLPIEDARDMMRERKDEAIDHVAGLLGASLIKRELLILDEKTKKVEYDGSGNYKLVKADVALSEDEREKVRHRYDYEQHAPGQYTRESYDEAVDYCVTHGLMNDPEFRRLLENRRPEHPNKLTRSTYSFELTRECESLMDIAIGLNVMKDVFKLSAGFHSSTKISRTIRLKVTFEFGELK